MPVSVEPAVPVVPLVEVLDGIVVVVDVGSVALRLLPDPVVVDVPLVDEPEVVVSVVVVLVEGDALGVVAEGLGAIAEGLGVVAAGVAAGSDVPEEPDVWAKDAPMAVTRAAAAAAMVKVLGNLDILDSPVAE